MSIKRLLTSFCATLLLGLPATAAADEGDSAFQIMTEKGIEATFLLGEKPVITYNASSVVINVSDVDFEYPRKNITEIRFVKATSGIVSPETTAPEITLQVKSLLIHGIDQPESVAIYSPAGIRLNAPVDFIDGGIRIDLSAIESNIIFINIPTLDTLKLFLK